MATPTEIAQQIHDAYVNADESVRHIIDTSPEPHRAMMYELGVVDGSAIDGTDEYHAIIDAILER